MQNDKADTLNYFPQAGAVIGRNDFFSRLRLSPAVISIAMGLHPMFDDNNPVMSIVTNYEVNLSVDLRLDNADTLLQKDLTPSIFEVYDHLDVSKKRFNIPRATEEGEILNFRVSQQVAIAQRTDEAIKSEALRMLGTLDESGKPARGEKWFKGLSELVADYAKTTDFIIKSGNSVIVQPTPAPEAMPVEIVPMMPGNAMPSVTMQQVEEARRERHDIMNAIIDTFKGTNRIIVTQSIDELRLNPDLLAQVEFVIDQHTEGRLSFESYVPSKIMQVIEGTLIPLEV